MTDALRIGDVARSAGVSVQTLRYYERRGIVVPAFRRHSGQREYRPDDVSRVRVVKAAQRLGFTLTEIQEMFELSGHRRGPAELRAMALAKLAEVDDRVEQLQAIRAELARVAEAECTSLTDCSCGFADPRPFERIGAGA